ncbi:MAG: hypothetical protein ABIO67_07715 [Mycobacteriales bacterium]
MDPDYKQTLVALESGVRVPREEQVEEHDCEPPRDYLEPEDLDRVQLLANPASAGRLNPRG